LAKGLSYASRQADAFRRQLEDACAAKYGGIDLPTAATIHTATEAQRVASANRIEKREAAEQGNLSLELSIAFDREYLRALAMRDQSLKALRLEKTARERLAERFGQRLQRREFRTIDGKAQEPNA
jgi:hypothetical protein